MKILIAPLDWGLGHATRCVPVIRALLQAGHEVVPCAGGAGLRLLRAEFPGLETRALPAYAMRYTRRRALLPLWLLLQLPLFLFSVWRDGRNAARLARELRADVIIADGRYGFRCAAVPAVFVTHQLGILPPGPRALRALLVPVLRVLNRRALRAFREVWVPDFPRGAGERGLSATLGGVLGHPPGAWPRARYIYPLCRFRPEKLPWDRALAVAADGVVPVDVLALVSGPEPQRTLLEEKLRGALGALPGTRVLVRGVPAIAGGGPGPRKTSPQLRAGALNVFDHLGQEDLLTCLAAARSVVCRSGYTTLMELAGLGKASVLLVPTPGQPEQEYLAEHARASGFAAWQDQDALDVPEGLRRAEGLPGFSVLFDPGPRGDESARAFDLAAWIRRHPLFSG